MGESIVQNSGQVLEPLDVGAIITDAIQRAPTYPRFNLAQNIRAFLLEQPGFNAFDERLNYGAIAAYLQAQGL